MLYTNKVTREPPMQLQLDGYAIQTVMQALKSRPSDERIAEAEAGERPNFSIEGAKMMKDDLVSRWTNPSE